MRDGKFKIGSTPNGFRGIEWGTDISSIKGMGEEIKDEVGNLELSICALACPELSSDFSDYIKSLTTHTKCYNRSEDEQKIGGAEVVIAYYFWKGRFYLAAVYACDINDGTEDDDKNWNALKDAVFEKFGEGYSEKEDEYYWLDDISVMSLRKYDKGAGLSKLVIASKKMLEEIRNYTNERVNVKTKERMEKAKEGAERGF